MGVAQLKNDLIQLTIETDNPALLEKVIAYFKGLREQEDWWDKLSEKEKAFVQRSSKQIDEMKLVPREVVQAEAKRILNK